MSEKFEEIKILIEDLFQLCCEEEELDEELIDDRVARLSETVEKLSTDEDSPVILTWEIEKPS